MGTFQLTTTLEAPCPVVRIVGELDVASGPLFVEEVELLVGAGFVHIVVDLGELTFLDSSGIGCLVAAILKVGDQGRITLARPQDRVARTLALAGLTEHIEVHDTVDLARLHAAGAEG